MLWKKQRVKIIGLNGVLSDFDVRFSFLYLELIMAFALPKPLYNNYFRVITNKRCENLEDLI